MIRTLLAATLLLAPAAAPAQSGAAQRPPRAQPPAQPPARSADAAADDDARRAAAGRVLAASRFRERQGVLLSDSLSAARADLTGECIDRAAAGRSLAECRATAEPGADVTARLAARRSDMLDEIMAASQTVYARRFTAAEMDEITRFFRTPVGQKYGLLYPDVIAEVQQRKGAIARRYLLDATRTNRPAAGARP